MPGAVHMPAISVSGLDPALHGLGGVGGRGVVADPRIWRPAGGEGEPPLPQQKALLSAQRAPAPNEDLSDTRG